MGWGVHDYPSPPEKRQPICPVCFEECEEYFIDGTSEIIGCNCCIMRTDAYDYCIDNDCFDSIEEDSAVERMYGII